MGYNIDDYIKDNVAGMLETLLDKEPTENEIDKVMQKINYEDIFEYIDSKIQDAINDI